MAWHELRRTIAPRAGGTGGLGVEQAARALFKVRSGRPATEEALFRSWSFVSEGTEVIKLYTIEGSLTIPIPGI